MKPLYIYIYIIYIIYIIYVYIYIYIYIYSNVGKLGKIIYSPVIYLVSINDAFFVGWIDEKRKILI